MTPRDELRSRLVACFEALRIDRPYSASVLSDGIVEIDRLTATLEKAELEMERQDHENERLRTVARERDRETTRLITENNKLRQAASTALVSLTAAISLLENSPKTGAPSNKMFDIMLTDYKSAANAARKTLKELE